MRTFLRNVWLLYYDGFRTMTLGKTLWTIIIVKLLIMFLVLKLLFFPSVLGSKSPQEKAEHVSKELLTR